VRPISLDHASLHLHLPFAAASPALLALLLARGRLSRREGVLLVGLYAAYVAAAIAV